MTANPTTHATSSAFAADQVPSLLTAQRRSLDNTNSIHIEQMTGSLPYDCHFNTVTGFTYRKPNPDGTHTYTHAYCNMMTCRSCAKRRCIQAVREIKEAIISQKLLTQITLTLPPDTRDHEQARALARALRRLLRNINERLKRPFTYVWAYGCGTTGRLHLHLVTNAIRSGSRGQKTGVTNKWIKDRWHKLTGATQTHFLRFPPTDAKKIARYLMKNVLETVFSGYRLKRRYSSSRDIKLMGSWPSEANDSGEIESGKWERIRGPSARHGSRLGVLEPNYELNPTFNATLALPPGPPIVGTDIDWPDESDDEEPLSLGGMDTPTGNNLCITNSNKENENE